jgi:hypothetical protein
MVMDRVSRSIGLDAAVFAGYVCTMPLPIDRTTAELLASRHLEEIGSTGFHVAFAKDIFELKGVMPLVYTPTPLPRGDRCWVVYFRGPRWGTVLESSHIVVVSKEDGEILYCGSANDEG